MIGMLMKWITLGIELAGIAIIVLGAVISFLWFIAGLLKKKGDVNCYHEFRANLGRSILLGLEFLVAADIISTVAIEPTLNSVAVLGVVVLIRTFLSFALEIEIEGSLPWRRAEKMGK